MIVTVRALVRCASIRAVWAGSLGPGEITQVALLVEAIALEATVTGGSGEAALPETGVELVVDLPIDEAVVAAVDIDIGREAPERFALGVAFRIDGTLFDHIDFAASVGAGSLHIGEASELGAELTRRLLQNPLEVEVQ